jgi:hypothetical protein
MAAAFTMHWRKCTPVIPSVSPPWIEISAIRWPDSQPLLTSTSAQSSRGPVRVAAVCSCIPLEVRRIALPAVEDRPLCRNVTLLEILVVYFLTSAATAGARSSGRRLIIPRSLAYWTRALVHFAASRRFGFTAGSKCRPLLTRNSGRKYSCYSRMAFVSIRSRPITSLFTIRQASRKRRIGLSSGQIMQIGLRHNQPLLWTGPSRHYAVLFHGLPARRVAGERVSSVMHLRQNPLWRSTSPNSNASLPSSARR